MKALTVQGRATIDFTYTMNVADDFVYDEDDLDDDTAEMLAERCDGDLARILTDTACSVEVEVENWFPAAS
jgi:hypothetical protein